MKVFATKPKSLSLLPLPKPRNAGAAFEVTPLAIRDSFRGWLHAVTPVLPGPIGVTARLKRLPRLTAQDVMTVNHATIREGESHCIWPPAAFEQFRSANVIRGNKTRYEIDDANLIRISD
ncbi:MAG TPA: hypothetical protein VI306_16865 [Pyrinomonadaceae bacterium]